jgi:hypothetical protein
MRRMRTVPCSLPLAMTLARMSYMRYTDARVRWSGVNALLPGLCCQSATTRRGPKTRTSPKANVFYGCNLSTTQDRLSSGGSDVRPTTGTPTNRRKWLSRLVMSLGALAAGGFVWWDRRGAQVPTEIFNGITYGCERLEATDEGSGLLHWARVDLTASGIELYVTPLDASAVAQGWQYRLRQIKNIVDKEHLAIAINATLFTSNSGWRPRMSGDLANGGETVVADHVVSHVWEHTYLLWFDDHLTPQLLPSKPPAAAELDKAKWGIGGQGVGLQNGKVGDVSSSPDARTAVAVDRERKLLFLAVGEYIDLGAKDGMLLDGGGSSSIALGKDAAGVPAGVLYGGWRPVATYFGVRATPLRSRK